MGGGLRGPPIPTSTTVSPPRRSRPPPLPLTPHTLTHHGHQSAGALVCRPHARRRRARQAQGMPGPSAHEAVRLARLQELLLKGTREGPHGRPGGIVSLKGPWLARSLHVPSESQAPKPHRRSSIQNELCLIAEMSHTSCVGLTRRIPRGSHPADRSTDVGIRPLCIQAYSAPPLQPR